MRAPTIRAFRRTDQRGSRSLVESGLADCFGRIDPTANPDLVDIQESYLASGHRFFVAEETDRIVGTTGLLLLDRRSQLVRVSVAREFRRRGIGSALLHRCISESHSAGLASMIVYTQPEWRSAVAFYSGHGFTQYGRDADDIHLRLLLDTEGVNR